MCANATRRSQKFRCGQPQRGFLGLYRPQKCSELLNPTRESCEILSQRQPGKYNRKGGRTARLPLAETRHKSRAMRGGILRLSGVWRVILDQLRSESKPPCGGAEEGRRHLRECRTDATLWHPRASTKKLPPPEKFCEKMCPTWRHISFHTDKNRYYT